MNKRVSQLTSLSAAEIAENDLFYIVDVSAKEGKKVTTDSLSDYLNNSASLNASHADTADTASYILGSNVDGTVDSSSLSQTSVSSSWASSSLTTISASYALTASYAANSAAVNSLSASWASSSVSSSYSTNAVNAVNASSAAFLIYSPTNGSASFAVRSGTSINSNTASYLLGTIESASYAVHAGTVDSVDTASYLLLTPGIVNGTASHALTAGNIANNLIDYGIYLANTQSTTRAQLDNVTVGPSSGLEVNTSVVAMGTVLISYTSSVAVNESLELMVQNRETGVTASLDSTPIYFYMSPTVGEWNTFNSGTVKIPFSLMGQSSLSGSYFVYVTSSANTSTGSINIESTRTTRFNISSLSENLTETAYEALVFNLDPTASAIITFSSSLGGPFTDYRNGFITSGSSGITVVDVRSQNLTSLRYVWTLNNLSYLDLGDNVFLDELTGMPNTLTTLICDSCSLKKLPDLPATLSYLNCGQNSIDSLPTLPDTMSYLNCASNNLTVLPSNIPYGTIEMYFDDNSLGIVNATFPSSLSSMSLSNNSVMDWGVSSLPISLVYLNVNNTVVSFLPTLPVSLSYINAENCALTQNSMDDICSQSLALGIVSGSLLLAGNGIPFTSTINDYILPLTVDAWTVTWDT